MLGTKRTSSVWEQSDVFVVLDYAAISVAIAVSLWGAGRIVRRLEALRTIRSATLEGERRERFRGMDSTVGPIAASGAAALVFGVSTIITDGWMPAILIAQAYEPVHEERTLEALERQRGLLAAADALEKRASGIHEWPFAERTPTLVITITTSVIAMTIGRLTPGPFRSIAIQSEPAACLNLDP